MEEGCQVCTILSEDLFFGANPSCSTVVGDNINIMKTTFRLSFDFYQAFKQHGYTKIWKQKEVVNLKNFTLITCKLVIRKKLVYN